MQDKSNTGRHPRRQLLPRNVRNTLNVTMGDTEAGLLRLQELSGLVSTVTAADAQAAACAGAIKKLPTCVSGLKAALPGRQGALAGPATDERERTKLARGLLAESQKLWVSAIQQHDCCWWGSLLAGGHPCAHLNEPLWTMVFIMISLSLVNIHMCTGMGSG